MQYNIYVVILLPVIYGSFDAMYEYSETIIIKRIHRQGI